MSDKIVTVSNLVQYHSRLMGGEIGSIRTLITDTNSSIQRMINGGLAVQKAQQDGDGRVISTTYATKSEMNNLVNTMSTVFRLCGVLDSAADLPDATTVNIGDVYVVGSAEFVCVYDQNENAQRYERLGMFYDFATDTDIEELFH